MRDGAPLDARLHVAAPARLPATTLAASLGQIVFTQGVVDVLVVGVVQVFVDVFCVWHQSSPLVTGGGGGTPGMPTWRACAGATSSSNNAGSGSRQPGPPRPRQAPQLRVRPQQRAQAPSASASSS